MKLNLIVDHLVRETALFRELIAVLQKETVNLINRDYNGIHDTSAKKENILLRLTGMEKARKALVMEAAMAMNVEGVVREEAYLSTIIASAPQPYKDELLNHQSAIHSLIESVKEINKVNSLVVSESLDNINKTLGFLGNFIPNNNYKKTGAFQIRVTKGSHFNEGV